ncbi:UNVERIFIED_CONTAM: hypothetical protein PYX00_010908 [Menopon gallinae]|uniref:Multifunctional fusion protein n=1 Tax=Menopon gallinae TaxID=328185 RepID=A0AAW2H6N8_9NEOP
MREGLAKGAFSSYELVKAFKEVYEEDQKQEKALNAYVEFFEDSLKEAQKADELRQKGDSRPYLGIPLAIKDNILIKGRIASAASHVLEDFIAPYNATVIQRLKEAGFLFLGRTNMDEFGMGSSNEYSLYSLVRNPQDRTRTSGGSSGGSAAVVAGFQAPLALGTDTGGSVRLPSAFTGIYGYKPSYGLLSRYGVIAYASSLDQIGLMARSPQDIQEVLKLIKGRDTLDMTSRDYDLFPSSFSTDPKSLTIATLEELSPQLMSQEVHQGYVDFLSFWKNKGAMLKSCSLPLIEDSLAIYYVLSLCEAASNLARYDGVRYGKRLAELSSLEELYQSFRSQNMGEEVQRRVSLGNYFLSSQSGEESFYNKTLKVLESLKAELEKLFEQVDLLLVPTSFTLAFKLGEKNNDPLQMYLSDLGTIFVNLAGLPAVSVPVQKQGLGVGMQLIGKLDPLLRFDRKHYMYPDLSKGYQISQNAYPLGSEGEITLILKKDQLNKVVRIQRVHMEEDTGKSLHLQSSPNSYIDYNRAGVPLLEIVSYPDLNTSEEAVAYVKHIHEMVRYLGFSDGNMEEGSFRCDVNVNLHLKKEGRLYKTPIVELKNLNSFRKIHFAIEYERLRQLQEFEKTGLTLEKTAKQTRGWSDKLAQTFKQREKESVQDYRYMREPDIPLICLEPQTIKEWISEVGEFPQEARKRLQREFGLSDFDVSTLTNDRNLASYFEQAVQGAREPKKIANWLLTEVAAVLNQQGWTICQFPLSPQSISELVNLISEGAISGAQAKEVFSIMCESGQKAGEIVEQKGFSQLTQTEALEVLVEEVLIKNAKSVADYRAGKEAALKYLMGQIMRQSEGKANPVKAQEVLLKQIQVLE